MKFSLVVMLYFFVLQLILVWWLRNDHRWYILAGVNAVFLLMLLMLRGYRVEDTMKKEFKKPDLFQRERSSLYEQKQNAQDEEENLPSVVSESNIEHIKIKINRTKPRSETKGAMLYRLLIFLLAVIGFGGCLFMLWDLFDFIAVVVGAVCMMFFLFVVFKGANLWQRSMRTSLYFLLFAAVGILGVGWLFAGDDHPVKERFKDQITLFIAGLHGELPPEETKDINSDTTGYLYESTGAVVNVLFTGDDQISGDMQEPIVISADGSLESSRGLSGEQTISGAVIQTGQSTSLNQLSSDATPLSGAVASNEPVTQITLLDAIKHLIVEYGIPLSTSKSVKFTHVAMSNPAYPYMKTALEKKMIGSTSNPDTFVSCDVYIVMKGLAEGWSVPKSAEIKADYRRLASQKNMLNGCAQGAKLTSANL